MNKTCAFQETEFHGWPLLKINYPQDVSRLEPHPQPYRRIVVHHAGSVDYTIEDLIGLHREKLGWGAIGYHFLIGSAGELYYARDLRFKGAHAYPNTGKIGISFLRSFEEKEPNERELATWTTFTKHLTEQLPIPVVGHNQDQFLELSKRYGLVADYPELAQRLLIPKSREDFEQAKQQLHRLHDTFEYHQLITKLKTCPGIGFYRRMPHG